MKFVSTRNPKLSYSISEAICCGLARDGGLIVPKALPKIDLTNFDCKLPFPQFSQHLLQYFFADDKLAEDLTTILSVAFHFPLPLKLINSNTHILELLHGPTASFKDFGARFLAGCLARVGKPNTTILVATSGDTGSAVASAFNDIQNIKVIILYPRGLITKRQEQQITCWADQTLALAVDGNFDDCQRLVKMVFQDTWCNTHLALNSANSINIGRLLAQICYYAYASMLNYQQNNTAPGFIIPTGNLGNAVAAYYAKEMGFPIREIVLATNANQPIASYLEYGKYAPHPTISTLANAMDVGNPSNFERLQYLFNDYAKFKNEVSVISCSDSHILNTIKTAYHDEGVLICPHTATAWYARKKLSNNNWIIVATADPAKFEDVIHKTLDVSVPIPIQIKMMLNKENNHIDVSKDFHLIKKHIKEFVRI